MDSMGTVDSFPTSGSTMEWMDKLGEEASQDKFASVLLML